MKIHEAIEKLFQGKCIRRKSWNKYQFVYFDFENNNIRDENDDYTTLCGTELIADDWELFIDYFNWTTALQFLDEGRRVARKAWETKNKNYHIFLSNGFFCEQLTETSIRYILTREDLLANDWYLVEEK